MQIFIPVDAIHYDSEIYSNPEVFDPERFTPEEVIKRHTCSWLPFGDGPRNCIGMRFAKLQTYVAIILLLKKFKFLTCESTQIPIKFNLDSGTLAPEIGISLKVEPLQT